MASTDSLLRLNHLELKNWRNFRSVDIDIADRLFIIGPNASGKSNLIDALRFLRELTIDGGGLQQAVLDRGGISRIRNLASRNFNGSRVTLGVSITDENDSWEYSLTLATEPRGRRRPVIFSEQVKLNGDYILDRPDSDDRQDDERLTQTALEQVNANRDFRPVSDFLNSTLYLHLVPQIIRDPDRAGDRIGDPFGADFLSRVAKTNKRERERRLRIINQALRSVVPQLEELKLAMDIDGRPHLEARYQHWRQQGAHQNEADFSDGTLRLIGLIWSLQERGRMNGPILLEEPELSLHEEIVRRLPSLLYQATKGSRRQVLATTHALHILDDPGLGMNEVVVLTPGEEGTIAEPSSSKADVKSKWESGLTLHESLADKLVPEHINELLTLF